MMTSLRSKWAVGKAVRAGLALEGASRTTLYTPGTLGLEGSMKVVRDVTDEQRGRQPIFNATLRAAASWLFFRVARSIRPAPFLRRLRNSHTNKRQKWGGMGASLAP
jgi:hypothetical protein